MELESKVLLPVHNEHSIGFSELMSFRLIAPDDVQAEFDQLLNEGKTEEATMILMKYIGHMKHAAMNYFDSIDTIVRSISKDNNYNLTHAVKLENTKSYYYTQQLDKEFVGQITPELVKLPANLEITVSFNENVLQISIIDKSIQQIAATELIQVPEFQKLYSDTTSLIKELSSFADQFANKESKDYISFKSDLDLLKSKFDKQSISLDDLNSIKQLATDLSSRMQTIKEQSIENKEQETEKQTEVKEQQTQIFAQEGTKIFDFSNNKMIELKTDMKITLIREQRSKSGKVFLLSQTEDGNYYLVPADKLKIVKPKVSFLKKSLYAPREYPEAGDTTITQPDIQEHPFDRYSPGSGASYLAMPNVGDTLGDRTTTRGHSGDAEYADKIPQETEISPVKDENTLIMEEYSLMKAEALNSQSNRALVEYYNELLQGWPK